jgi:Zn-finger nucleic acid-binding protein
MVIYRAKTTRTYFLAIRDLVQTKRDGIEFEICRTCSGMWLTRQELNQLENELFDFGDANKGSLIFSFDPTTLNCHQCAKLMKKFEYRLCDVEMDFCEDGHGFWLDKDEDKRVLELMKEDEAGWQRKVLAEDKWAAHLKYLRSGSFFDRVRDLLRWGPRVPQLIVAQNDDFIAKPALPLSHHNLWVYGDSRTGSCNLRLRRMVGL